MRTFGSSTLAVFPLALGGNTFGWTSSPAESHAVLDAFVAAGGTLIDTADGYSSWAPGNSGGESETIIGDWLRRSGNRDRVSISTKVGQHPDFPTMRAANVTAAADASLARLGTDHIDLYFAHDDDPSTPLEETIAAFDELVSAGKVRHVGLSNYSADRVVEWITIARDSGLRAPIALQPHYNLVHREPYESEFAPVVEQHDLGVMPYFALASGFLTGKYRSRADSAGAAREGMVGNYFTEEAGGVVSVLREVAATHDVAPATVALGWLLAQPHVVAPIASARVAAQLADLTASATLTLSPDELATLDTASARTVALS